MGADLMGRVTVEAVVENLLDLARAEFGNIAPDDVRAVVIPDALVDTGATMLSLPTQVIEQLGLRKSYERPARSSRGTSVVSIYEAVRLTIQGREHIGNVAEVPDGVPALIGQIPLEQMDWVVDPVGQRLIGNPEHGGEQMLELY